MCWGNLISSKWGVNKILEVYKCRYVFQTWKTNRMSSYQYKMCASKAIQTINNISVLI